MIGYIVMRGDDYEGLTNDDEPYKLYWDRDAAVEISKQYDTSNTYGDVIEIEVVQDESAGVDKSNAVQ